MKQAKLVFMSFVLIFSMVWGNLVLASPIKVATWNLEWLNRENNKGNTKRADGDYAKLAEYAKVLAADIVVMEEVDAAAAAKRVFDENKYQFIFSDRNYPQRVGIAYNDKVQLLSWEQIEAFDVDSNARLRYGIEAHFQVDNMEFVVLALHLKSGCFSGNLAGSTNTSCSKLARQLVVLEDWINNMASSGMPFIIAGDLNRRLNPSDPFWLEIDDGVPAQANLYSPAMHHTSTCNGGRYPEYIDHIILDSLATGAYVDDSFSQVIYSDDDRSNYVLSDHCPISVELNF